MTDATFTVGFRNATPCGSRGRLPGNKYPSSLAEAVETIRNQISRFRRINAIAAAYIREPDGRLHLPIPGSDAWEIFGIDNLGRLYPIGPSPVRV
jgi:hypothetical protein